MYNKIFRQFYYVKFMKIKLENLIKFKLHTQFSCAGVLYHYANKYTGAETISLHGR